MASVQVFGSPASMEVQRVLACLFEKKVDFQLVKMDSFRGPKRLPEFLKMQLRGEALSYQDDKIALIESRAICRNIVDNFKNQGNKDLMGEGALERALIEQWLETESHKFDPPSSELVFFLAVAPTLPEPDLPPTSAIEESKKKLEKVLQVYDDRLADNQFLTGSNFTLADLSHLPNTEQLMRIDETRNLFERHGNVSRWWKDVSKRESWEKVIQIAKQPPPMA